MRALVVRAVAGRAAAVGVQRSPRSCSSALRSPWVPSTESHIIADRRRQAAIGVRARRRSMSIRNWSPRRRRWSDRGNWRRND